MGVSLVAELPDTNERIEAAIGRYGPFVGLAIGVAITAGTASLIPYGPVLWPRVAVLVTATVAWCAVLAFRRIGDDVWAARPVPGAVYVAGLVVLIAALLAVSPWFAFLAVPAYAHAHQFLRGHWRYVGMSAVAVLHAWAIIGGGLAGLSPAIAIGTLLIAAVLAPAVVLFTSLNARVIEQSRTRAATIAELNRALDENAVLHARLVAQAREAGVQSERTRMAREIHDTLAQGLTGIVTQLEAAGADDADARRHVDTARALARESLTEARRSVEALAPGRLADAQLPEAITAMAKDWSETAQVAVHVDITGDPVPLLPEIEVTLFRVAQEALANVGRHARASRVGITLSYMDDVVALDVRDDGVGLPEGHRAGFGLTAMEQRVRRVSGTLEIEGTDGTAVSATLPALPAREEDR